MGKGHQPVPIISEYPKTMGTLRLRLQQSIELQRMLSAIFPIATFILTYFSAGPFSIAFCIVFNQFIQKNKQPSSIMYIRSRVNNSTQVVSSQIQ